MITDERRKEISELLEVPAKLPYTLHMRRAIKDLLAENARLRAALEKHHKWRLEQTGTDNEFGIDLAEAYAESTLCDITLAALSTTANVIADSGGDGEQGEAQGDSNEQNDD